MNQRDLEQPERVGLVVARAIVAQAPDRLSEYLFLRRVPLSGADLLKHGPNRITPQSSPNECECHCRAHGVMRPNASETLPAVCFTHLS